MPSDQLVEDRRALAVSAARGRARRSWRRYLVALAVCLLALATFMFAVWRTSEIRAVRDHPTTKVARELPTGALPASLRRLWTTSDRLALGEPVYLDVVATYSTHTVVGRDATTGAVRWSYSRSDRTVCAVVADGNTFLAIYRHDGNCDELSMLDAQSGKRDTTRTQFEDGTPTIQPISQYVLQLTPASVDLIQPGPGAATYWYYPQVTGCRTTNGVVGNNGVLWGTRCGAKTTLTFRIGSGDKNKKNAWSVDLAGRTPLSADNVIAALSPDRRSIQVLSAKDGSVTSTVVLPTAAPAPTEPFATPSASSSTELVYLPGEVVGLSSTSRPTLLWHAAAADGASDTSLGLLVPAAGLVREVNTTTGRTAAIVRVPTLPAGSRVVLRGRGLVSGTASGTVAWG